MKKKQLMIMLGAMTLALLLGTAPVVQNVAAAGLPVSISQKAKQDALEHADIIDTLKKGSVAIRKYDMTAAQAAGDYSEDMYVATGEKDTVAEQKLADYAMEGVQFSCLRVGNIETHSVQKGTETSVELIYEIPEKLADILKLMKENAVDMSKEGEAYPCHNTGVLHYTGQQISDALEAILKADEVAAKNALEHYLYDYGTLDATTDRKAASGVCNLPKTDRNGYTHLDNLELGLYLFVETEVPEQVTDTVNPWFVQLPFTSADGDMWQYDMNVYPKNQSGNPTLDKSVRNAYSNTLSVNEQVPSGTDKNTSVHAGEAYIAGNDSEALIVYNREAQSADLTDAAIGKRPVAVMVNNIPAAMPQYGVEKADIIFEIPVEGDQTRFMALYADYTTVPQICAIRSCRYYFPALSQGFDAFYVNWGIDDSIADYLEALNLDQYDGIYNAGGLFGRDMERRNQGYALEHTGYFDGTKFAEVVQNTGKRTDLAEDKKGTAFQFNGLNEQVKPSEDVCKKVSIDFGAQSATLVYDEASNTYKKEIDGNAQIDGKTGNQLAFTNVFVLETTISVKDDLGHKAVDWDGWEDSMGYYISNGAKQKIHWSKEENNELSRLTFYDESGNEISINRGKSYIAFNYPNQTAYE